MRDRHGYTFCVVACVSWSPDQSAQSGIVAAPPIEREKRLHNIRAQASQRAIHSPVGAHRGMPSFPCDARRAATLEPHVLPAQTPRRHSGLRIDRGRQAKTHAYCSIVEGYFNRTGYMLHHAMGDLSRGRRSGKGSWPRGPRIACHSAARLIHCEP